MMFRHFLACFVLWFSLIFSPVQVRAVQADQVQLGVAVASSALGLVGIGTVLWHYFKLCCATQSVAPIEEYVLVVNPVVETLSLKTILSAVMLSLIKPF